MHGEFVVNILIDNMHAEVIYGQRILHTMFICLMHLAKVCSKTSRQLILCIQGMMSKMMIAFRDGSQGSITTSVRKEERKKKKK